MGADGTTRREALALATAAATFGFAGRVDGAGRHDDALDEALRRLHRAEPKVTQGLSTHAPMAAEALCALRAVSMVDMQPSGVRHRKGGEMDPLKPVRHESPTPSPLRAEAVWGMLRRSPLLHLRRGRRLMGPRTAEGRDK